MGDALLADRPDGRDQGLSQHLPAEYALPALLRAAAAKQVLFQGLQVQYGD